MIRTRTFAKNRTDLEKYDGPWKTDFEQMALKTVVRRLFKFLPVSVEMVIMDALRRPDADELALSEAAAAMLEDNPGQTLDMTLNEVAGREPVEQAGQAEQGEESMQTDFDNLPGQSLGQRIEHALLAAKTRDVLDVAADEIRELAKPEERAKLEALYRERCEMLQ
jgi:hypothetical protein